MQNYLVVEPRPRRTRSLLTLPPELLATIVRMCSEQDEAFRRRVKILRRNLEPSDEDVRRILEIQENVGYGSSVNTLFQVCKTLSKLAAPYIFHTVRSLKASSSLTYRYWVSKRRAQHFKRVILDSSASVELDFFIASFDQFSSATELHLDFLSAPRLYDALLRPSTGEGPAWWSYKRLAASISDLTLNSFDLETTTAYKLIAACSKLQTLTLLLGRLPINKVNRFVGSFPHLESLTIRQDQEGGDEGDLPAKFLGPTVPWPRLKRLSIISKELLPNTIKFVQGFAHSLEELSLETLPDYSLHNMVSPLVLSASPIFPRLRKITTVKSSVLAYSIFSSTNRSTFPSLSRVRLSVGESPYYGYGKDDEILELLWANHKFKFLEYVEPTYDLQPNEEDLKDQAFILHKAKLHKVKVFFRDYPERWIPNSDLINDFERSIQASVSNWIDRGPSDASRLKSLESQIEPIQAHIDDRCKKAKLIGNPLELERLLLLLRPVEFDRLATMD
ncbi:hypothetical protein JCM5350_005269 [Sporobolomyces pararoseus]